MFDIYTSVVMRFSDTKLTNLAYDAEAANQEEFEPLIIKRPKLVTAGETGRLLNQGIGYSKLYYSYYKYEFTLSADQITDNVAIEFLENFKKAICKYIIFNKGGNLSAYNYVEVIEDFGEMPIDYLDDIQFMPEIKFTMNSI